MMQLKISFCILLFTFSGVWGSENTQHHTKNHKKTNQIALKEQTPNKPQEAIVVVKEIYPCKIAHCKECYPKDFMKCQTCNDLYQMNREKDECYEPSEFLQFGYRLLLSSVISFIFFLIMFLYYYYTKLHKSLTKNLADYIDNELPGQMCPSEAALDAENQDTDDLTGIMDVSMFSNSDNQNRAQNM